jgi:Inner membrane component of T3SS, cytoplasmic domain
MTMDDQIRIDRQELFDPAVDQALARERSGRERVVADAPPVGAIRRLLHESLLVLPIAAVLAALATWLLLEPKVQDMPTVGGEVVLINDEPFDAQGMISLTVGTHEVYVDPARIQLEPGADGAPAFDAVEHIKLGDRVEVTGMAHEHRLVAAAIRPAQDGESRGEVDKPLWPLVLMFPLTAALIAFGLLFAEGLTTRNWLRMIERSLLGSFLAALFAGLAFIPAGLILLISKHAMSAETMLHPDRVVVTIHDVGATTFLILAACRSAAWACIGAAIGLGMNLVRSTRPQLRNSVIGGALGGALGGLFFDPISRFVESSLFDGAGASRLVGLLAVGVAIGVFVALVERLSRDAWLRVRTGPLAGKSFILYKTPTRVGSASSADVYLYKDAEIDPAHVAIHRVGVTYEIEDLGSRMGTTVGGARVRRRRLVSGDQIVIGSTVLDFEERQKRTPTA